MTPLQIKMMLHYYTSTEPYSARDLIHANSQSVYEQRDELIKWELLTYKFNSAYEVTEKGKFYIEYLLSVPVPSIKYVIEVSNKENTNEA